MTLDWQSDALCAQTSPDIFTPDKGDSSMPAKRICAACEVRQQCLEYALVTDQRQGIYGGTSPLERRAMRRAAA